MPRLFMIFPILLTLAACSEQPAPEPPPAVTTGADHVFNAQTEALRKAKEAAKLVEEGAEQRMQEIDSQAQ